MMALRTTTAKIQPLVRRAVQSNGIRPMTVLSKQSGEEYKKMVRLERCIHRFYSFIRMLLECVIP